MTDVPAKPVLQYGSLAGWPFSLAEGLTLIGCPSLNVVPDNLDWQDLDRKLPYHHAISASRSPRTLKAFQRAKFLAGIPSRYSLVHYHASHLMRPSWHPFVEGPYLKSQGISMIVSFSGSDVRIVEEARKQNPYFFKEPDRKGDDNRRRYLSSISKYVRYAATDCEVADYIAPYFEKVFTFRQPILLERFVAKRLDEERPPILLHVPTDIEVKGTQHVLAAVERLRAENLKFEFRCERRLAQTAFDRALADCDVYVDELRCGSHGVTAVEAMAAGKATVTYIRPDLLDKFPSDMPLVNANPETIYLVLKRLICDPQWRVEVAAKGRPYVEKYHDSRIVAKQMLNTYREAKYLPFCLRVKGYICAIA